VSVTSGAVPISRPILAGIVSGLVGFSSAFVIVLAGLMAVGADRDQASSGLLAVSVVMGACTILLALWTRMPITVAWSTPGAALLAATGLIAGEWSAAVGAFLVTGVLIVLTGLIPQLGRLIARIPRSVAQAMLAGVLLPLCLGPVVGVVADPLAVAPIVLVWLLAARFLPKWAVPLAFLTAAIVIGVHLAISGASIDAGSLAPVVTFTAPTFSIAGIVGIALPLYLVTMASQNVAGVAVMHGLGYEVPWRRSMIVTGVGTLVAAPAGGHAVNLAAISAALAAGPEAGEDRGRRWIAGVTNGIVVIVLGIGSSLFTTLIDLAPESVVPAVAGLALLATLASAIQQALEDPNERIPAIAAFVTAASGMAIWGVSAAFWSLVAGLVVRFTLTFRK